MLSSSHKIINSAKTMNFALDMKSLPIVSCGKNQTNFKYGTIKKWILYDNFTVKYEWSCSEKNNSCREEIKFENLPLEIQMMIAKAAIKSPFLKNLESEKQLMLVHLAVLNN